MKRAVLMATVVVLSCLGLASPVLAASPGNDLYAGRSIIAALPYSDAVDTSEATSDDLDAAVNANCGAPATDASVWYEFTPSADGLIGIDAFASDYTVGIIVIAGTPDASELRGCAPGGFSVSTTAGETLTILIFDYDGVGNGGNLVLSVTEAPPPPVLELTVASQASVNPRTGVAIIRGTITCTGGEESGKNFLEVQLTQIVGRFRIDGSGSTTFACNGLTEAWSVEVVSYNGVLGGGKATVSAFAFACSFDCGSAEAQRTVTLRR